MTAVRSLVRTHTSAAALARPRDRGEAPDACRLIGLLGEGGMARVYLARHDRLGQRVAVKRLQPELARLPHARDRLLAEAEIARRVRHDHVVDVLDVVSEPEGESYFVMEHLAGEPLSSRLARTGALPLSETFTIAVQVASALDAVHRRGIIHRDLKTENVLVGHGPDGRVAAKLIDFGVAEVLGARGPLDPPSVVGTPESMSPEQALGRPVDPRSDIYSFGVLVYEMLAAVPPFHGGDMVDVLRRVIDEQPAPPSSAPGAQRQFIPPALEELVLECLAKDPDHRPASMAGVHERLAAMAADYLGAVAAVEGALADDEPVLPISDLLVATATPVAEPAAAPSPRRCAVLPQEALPPYGAGVRWDLPPTGATPAVIVGRRLGPLAACALLVTVVAVGLLALFGNFAWTPHDLERLWRL